MSEEYQWKAIAFVDFKHDCSCSSHCQHCWPDCCPCRRTQPIGCQHYFPCWGNGNDNNSFHLPSTAPNHFNRSRCLRSTNVRWPCLTDVKRIEHALEVSRPERLTSYISRSYCLTCGKTDGTNLGGICPTGTTDIVPRLGFRQATNQPTWGNLPGDDGDKSRKISQLTNTCSNKASKLMS